MLADTIVEGASLISARFFGVCFIKLLFVQSRHERALLWPLFDWSAWDQPATVLEGTTFEGAALASVPLVGVSSSQALWWWERQVWVLLWPLFPRSAWAHTATGVADMTVDVAALTSFRSVGVGSGSHCLGGDDS